MEDLDNIQEFNSGLTHEQNKYGGIPISYDQQGNMNTVEDGEIKIGDFVFSNRIKANKDVLKENDMPVKYAKMSFADIADKYLSEAKRRPNDAIAQETLYDMADRLATAQEQQKAEEQFNSMSPEEKIAMMEQLNQANTDQIRQQQMSPEEMAMQEQMMAQQGYNDPQMQGQPSPEEMAMMQQGMMAYGGMLKPARRNMFAGGGGVDDIKVADEALQYKFNNPFIWDERIWNVNIDNPDEELTYPNTGDNKKFKYGYGFGDQLKRIKVVDNKTGKPYLLDENGGLWDPKNHNRVGYSTEMIKRNNFEYDNDNDIYYDAITKDNGDVIKKEITNGDIENMARSGGMYIDDLLDNTETTEPDNPASESKEEPKQSIIVPKAPVVLPEKKAQKKPVDNGTKEQKEFAKKIAEDRKKNDSIDRTKNEFNPNPLGRFRGIGTIADYMNFIRASKPVDYSNVEEAERIANSAPKYQSPYRAQLQQYRPDNNILLQQNEDRANMLAYLRSANNMGSPYGQNAFYGANKMNYDNGTRLAKMIDDNANRRNAVTAYNNSAMDTEAKYSQAYDNLNAGIENNRIANNINNQKWRQGLRTSREKDISSMLAQLGRNMNNITQDAYNKNSALSFLTKAGGYSFYDDGTNYWLRDKNGN